MRSYRSTADAAFAQECEAQQSQELADAAEKKAEKNVRKKVAKAKKKAEKKA